MGNPWTGDGLLTDPRPTPPKHTKKIILYADALHAVEFNRCFWNIISLNVSSNLEFVIRILSTVTILGPDDTFLTLRHDCKTTVT